MNIFSLQSPSLSNMKCLLKCPYSKKPDLPCARRTLVLTFHPNFHPNIFANLPIYRKLINDNIGLVFENQ